MPLMPFTIDAILTEEQISDIFLAYHREKKLGEVGNVHTGIVRCLLPYMSGVDTITGQVNNVDTIAYGIELVFDRNLLTPQKTELTPQPTAAPSAPSMNSQPE